MIVHMSRPKPTIIPHHHQQSTLMRLHYVEHHADDSTIWLSSTLILRESTLGWSGASHLSSSSTNLTRGLRARRLFRVHPCREGTVHLQASMPSPGFEHRPYFNAVSVTNPYAGWAAPLYSGRSVNEHNPFQDYVRYPNCSLTGHRFTIDFYVKSINSFWRP
ncbi:hypothetical protein TNCV_1850371 [Trichonephila clavipes]|nr:hypothetical protein TNCV_1850371 [Trichonephila clavipes]